MIIDKKLNLNRTSRSWFAVFDDDEKILSATKKVYSRGVNILDCFIPHPVHGMEAAMGIKRSRLPIIAFMMGCTGFLAALAMISYMMVDDWPMIIGGKPYAGIPAWVPVTFECTVLFTAFGMMAFFFIRNRMLFGIIPDLADIGQTDNKYVIAMDVDDVSINHDELEKLLRDSGAIEIKERKAGVTSILGEGHANHVETKIIETAEVKEVTTTVIEEKVIEETIVDDKIVDEKVLGTKTTKIESEVNKIELSEEEKNTRLEIIKTKLGEREGDAKDDLKLISGVGPVFEKTLNSIGVYTFEQVSRFDKESIQAVEDLIQKFPGRIERDDWVGQANKLKNK